MVESVRWDGAAGAELWRTTVRKLTLAAAASNGLGGLVLFLLLTYLIPFAPTGQVPLNAVVGVAYLATTLIIGTLWTRRLSEPIRRWLVAGRAPTDEERRLVLATPSRYVVVSGTFWTLAALLFTVLNAPGSGWSTLIIGGAVLMGGETTCAVGYLLVERLSRPVTVLALAGGSQIEPSGPGVGGRLMMAWSLGTGIPLLGILVLGIAGLADPHKDPPKLAMAIAFLAVVGFGVGLLAMTVASRSIADPIAAVRRGMQRVGEGDLDATVTVDDGSEIGLLEDGFNRMAAGLRERERIRDLFGRQVGEDVARAALERDGDVELGGEVREVAVVFADVIGSTGMASRRAPDEVVALLNTFFSLVVEVVERHGGWVNKFAGDAALALFGAPTERADAAGDSLRAARELRGRLGELRGADAAIGVSAGPAVAGNVGTQSRFEYTVIGDPVNEAARLSELAKLRPERLLASDAVLDRAGPEEAARWEVEDWVLLRGRDSRTGLATPRDANLPRRAGEHGRQGEDLPAVPVRGRQGEDPGVRLGGG
jgi:adenylate cyclase